MKEIFLKVIGRLMKEKGALWVCGQAGSILKEQGLTDCIWPISFSKGNLTLGVSDSFFIAQFKAKEKAFIRQINKKSSPFRVKRIFYRFSSQREYGPT